jgi:hypothetical protein
MSFYRCQHCGVRLSSEDGSELTFRGVLEAELFTVAAPFTFAAELGNYEFRVDGDLTMKEGARPDFQCPSCHRSFVCAWNADFAEIKMVAPENDREDFVVFSRVYGTRATFLCDKERQLQQAFGEDKEAYVEEFGKLHNFFGS